MTQVLEVNGQLTREELEQVRNFAEFLIARRARARVDASLSEPRPTYVNVDALVGLCAGMGGNKTDVELAHEATEIRVAKLDR